MANPILWRSPQIPLSVLEKDDFPWLVRSKVDELAADDEPSSNDIATAFNRYNFATSAEREAIDAAFVWMTGYTFATICAMVVTPNGKDYEQTLEKWRMARA
jgi:hypothetical protein